MIRSLEKLEQDQAAVLASYREDTARRETVAALPRPGGVTAVTVYARISGMVAADPENGPHLLAVRQKWNGTPPGLIDTAALECRCYPTPNHVVADYAVGEVVRLVVAHGAMVAERLC